MKVFRLVNVDLGVTNMDEMIHYYEKIMGLTLTERGDSGSAYLSTSTDHHNMALIPSEKSGIQRFGLQISNETTLEEAQSELREHGIDAKLKTDTRPGVSQLLEFQDPDGYTVQLFSSMENLVPGFKKEGIVPNKIGHLSLRSKDAKKAVEFYKLLGFKNTDWIEDYFGFMTCNRDHHVLNYFTSNTLGMHHIAFELRNYNHLIQNFDWLGKNNIPILWGPSRHGAGHNIASYHHDPEQNMIELFTDADIYIEELNAFEPRPWHEDFPQKPKVWGTDECITRWGTEFHKSLV